MSEKAFIEKGTDYYARYREAVAASLAGLEVRGADGAVVENEAAFERLCGLTKAVKGAGRMMYLCGNGASAAFANHMALDWSKNGGVPTQSFSDSALLTAICNDLGAEQMFAGPLRIYAKPGDLLATISSSGNSPNILHAIEAAKELGMEVVTFSGLKPENLCRQIGVLNFYVPARTYGVVECAHQILMHVWLDKFMGITEWDREGVQNMRAAEFRL